MVQAVIVQAYSAIYGGYDEPKPVRAAGFSHRPIMFTDQGDTFTEAAIKGWKPVLIDHYFESPHGDPEIVVPMLNHKYWKCHPDEVCAHSQNWPHEAYQHADITIWMDGSIEPHPGFEEKALAALGDDDWACVPHPDRNCIYPEAEYSATLTWRYDADSITAQAGHYRNFHPSNWGLFATGVNVRRHTEAVHDLSHLWWDEILNWSHQDQLSLPVLMRLQEGKVRWNQNLTWHQDWTLHPHGM